MPLSSQLRLDASPHSAVEARRWVGTLLGRLERDDLVECAELGVSELVTNAVLHGTPPITVKIRGTAAHPRIDVHDRSTAAPLLTEEVDDDSEDFLVTFGRGLSIVAKCASACGSTIEVDGKVVWFEPADEMRDAADIDWVIDDSVAEAPEPTGDEAVQVTLRGLDLELYEGLSNQYRELRRELRLLSLGHQDDYPLAANLTAMFANFERQFPSAFNAQIDQAMRAARATTDVTVRMLPEAGSIFVTMAEMFDLADSFCRAERLLSLERTPEQREFHGWLLGELVRQLGGQAPRAWRQNGDKGARRGGTASRGGRKGPRAKSSQVS